MAVAAPAEQGFRPGDDARPPDLAPIAIAAAQRVAPGDTIWYRDRPHVVRDVSLSGGFGFRPNGPCAPYYGLAGVESMVTRGGMRRTGGRLIEHGVTPAPFYTELDGERLGWVSYLLCEAPRKQEENRGRQRRVWWSRARKPALSTF
jgi:hypothetical protein